MSYSVDCGPAYKRLRWQVFVCMFMYPAESAESR